MGWHVPVSLVVKMAGDWAASMEGRWADVRDTRRAAVLAGATGGTMAAEMAARRGVRRAAATAASLDGMWAACWVGNLAVERAASTAVGLAVGVRGEEGGVGSGSVR